MFSSRLATQRARRSLVATLTTRISPPSPTDPWRSTAARSAPELPRHPPLLPPFPPPRPTMPTAAWERGTGTRRTGPGPAAAAAAAAAAALTSRGRWQFIDAIQVRQTECCFLWTYLSIRSRFRFSACPLVCGEARLPSGPVGGQYPGLHRPRGDRLHPHPLPRTHVNQQRVLLHRPLFRDPAGAAKGVRRGRVLRAGHHRQVPLQGGVRAQQLPRPGNLPLPVGRKVVAKGATGLHLNGHQQQR